MKVRQRPGRRPRRWPARVSVRRALFAAFLLASAVRALAGCAGTLAPIDKELFPIPPRDSVTFWGHACCYIDAAGFGIVTDPVFDTSPLFRTRKVPAPPRIAYLGARVVLISHAHDDHLSPRTLKTFPESTLVLCPLPAMRYLDDLRQPVRGMAPGDTYDFPGGRITAVVAHHPGSRTGVDAEADGRALGYVIETPSAVLYYSGDTDYFGGFTEVAHRYRPTMLVLNVNGHLNRLDAVRAARDSGARTILPVHHGAFGYLLVGERKQPRDYELLKKHLGPSLVPLALGASMPLTGPPGAALDSLPAR